MIENTKQKGRLFVLSGPSGTGKGTVVKRLLEKQEALQLSISATTRSPREGEVHGREYYFLSREAFLKMRDMGELLESAEFSGNFYGTPREYVEAGLLQGYDILLEIEAQGAGQVKALMPEAVLIFLYPPSMAELERRLRERGTDSDESILRRLKRAEEEMQLISQYDYVVENDMVELAVEKIEAIILAEKCRVQK